MIDQHSMKIVNPLMTFEIGEISRYVSDHHYFLLT